MEPFTQILDPLNSVAGSSTSSNAVFGQFQYSAAKLLHVRL
jgi:L-lactate permease